MAKFTNDDIDEIVTALQREKGNFAFLIGAGCSLSAGIPSGKKIAKDICENYPHQTKSLSNNEKGNYALCMGRLPIETRKQIINSYLDSPEVKLNWAHIALACLMEKGLVNRVLTFNFDNLLTRACGLLNLYPATYDFGSAPSTQTRHLVSPSILHLHGQGSGSVLLHTEKETERHAKEIEPLLADTFANFPMLVMGYSGESDKVFSKIKTLYKGDQALYWFGHDERPSPELKRLIDEIDGDGFCKYIGGTDADEIFIKLALQLDCFPPMVFTDPAGNLLLEIEKITDFPLEKTTFKTNILKKSRDKLEDKQTRDSLRLDAVDLAVLSNKPEDLPKSGEIGFENVPDEVAAWALIERGNEYFKNAKTTNSIIEYEKSVQQFEAALKIKPEMHQALNNWGSALLNIAMLQQDPAIYKASFVKFGDAIRINPDDHLILNNWGFGLVALAKLQQNPDLFQASISKFEAVLQFKPDHHEALSRWGTALSSLGQLRQEPSLLEASFVKFEAALKIKPDYYETFNNWGVAMATLAAIQLNVAMFEISFTKFDSALKIKPLMHEALNNWGNALSNLAQLQKDEALLETSFEKFEAALKIKPDYHEALNNWGISIVALAQFKQDPELLETSFPKFEAALKSKPDYHEALICWGDALSILAQFRQDPALFEASFVKFEAALKLKPSMYQALNSWGNAIVDLAQLKLNPDLYEASFAKFEAALKIKPDYYEALNNWGAALFDTWKFLKNIKYLKKATEVINKAEKLKPDECYNGACLASVKNDEVGCKVRLFRAKVAKTLPNRQHLEEDPDLANMRDKPWFAELLKDL